MHMDCLASFLGFHVVREAIVFSPLQAGMFQPPTKVTKKLVHMSNQKHGNVCEYVVDVVVSLLEFLAATKFLGNLISLTQLI